MDLDKTWHLIGYNYVQDDDSILTENETKWDRSLALIGQESTLDDDESSSLIGS